MYRILAGDKNTGVQGIYFFDTDEEAKRFGSSLKSFLDACRCGDTDTAKEIADKWIHNRAVYNFYCHMASCVGDEKDHPEVWWNPGGSLYGENWRNPELPNGRGPTYLGDKIIEEG